MSPPTVREWHDQLNLHEAQTQDLKWLEQFMQHLLKIGIVLCKQSDPQDVLLVHGSRPHGSLTTPLLGYSTDRFELRFLTLSDHTQLLSVHVLDGKPPAYPRLNNILWQATPADADPPLSELPPDWRHQAFGENPQKFTVWLCHEFWLFAFLVVLRQELEQYKT